MKKVMAATIVFFCLVWSCSVAQLHEEGASSYRHLLLPAAKLRAAQLHKEGDNSYCRLLLSAMEVHCNAVEEGDSIVELRYNTTKQATTVVVTFFFCCFVFFCPL